MYFYLTGVDYKRAPLSAREDIYRRRVEILDFWAGKCPGRAEALFTCNRIEIYGVAEDSAGAFNNMRAFAGSFPDFSRQAYFKYGEENVFRHALRLACGLESQLQGELQIADQLEAWSERESFGPLIKSFWKDVILLSKEIRSHSELDKYNDNIASLVYQDIVERVGSEISFGIIVVGTGKVAELFARYRVPRARVDFVSHKNYIRAESLAEISGGAAYLPKDLPGLISEADVIVSAASSPHYIVRKSHFEKITLRHGRRLYMYDLALPRGIEPEAGLVKGVLLRDMDDLEGIFERHNRDKKARIDFASALIERMVKDKEVVYAG